MSDIIIKRLDSNQDLDESESEEKESTEGSYEHYYKFVSGVDVVSGVDFIPINITIGEIGVLDPKCECGGDIAKSTHSTWCPKY